MSVDQEPDIVIEWLTAIHADQDETPAPAAHAAFPPGTPIRSGGVGPDPPLPIHFNDTDVEWTREITESYALHEIGHCLGLRHADEDSPFPCAPLDPPPPPGTDPLPPCPIMLKEGPAGQTDLQPDDLDGIRALFEVHSEDRRVRFNAVWADGSLERKARWGWTRADLQAEIEAQQAEGFKPGSINAYVRADGSVVYNAVLDQIGQRRPYVTERTRENFAAEHIEKTEQGFRPISVSAFVHPDGAERFNGVWADDADASEMIFGATRDEFDRERARLKQRGYRPMQISAHVLPDGQERWNGVFWKNSRESMVLLGATREQFNEAAEQNKADGFRVDDITTYLLPNGQGERWNGVWERNDYPEHRIWGWRREDFERRVARIGVGPRDPWVLNAYVQPPTLTGAQIVALDDVTPPQELRPVVLGVALDEARVYATRFLESAAAPHTSGDPGELLAIDRSTLRIVGRVKVGYRPRKVAVNPRNGRVYVTNLDPRSFSLTVIDGTSLEVLDTVPLGQGPTFVAVNPTTNRVYVSNQFQRRIHVLDGDTHAPLEPIPIGPGPQGLAVDESTGTIYVALFNGSFEPHVSALGVVTDEGTHHVIHPPVPIGSNVLTQPQDVAVDADNDRVYVANLGGGGVPPSVTVLHRPTLDELATVHPAAPVRAIAVNGDAREAYVATDGQMHVIDAGTLTITRTIPTGPTQAITVAAGSARQVYVGGGVWSGVTRLA